MQARKVSKPEYSYKGRRITECLVDVTGHPHYRSEFRWYVSNDRGVVIDGPFATEEEAKRVVDAREVK